MTYPPRQGGQWGQHYPQQPGSFTPGPPDGGPKKRQYGILAAAAVLFLAFVFGLTAFVVPGFLIDDADSAPVAEQPSKPPSTAAEPTTEAPRTTPPASDVKQPKSTKKPTLERKKRVSVLGPNWTKGDKTFSMEFPGWPFAFRTPADFNCVAATSPDMPDAYVWTCQGKGGRVNLALQKCPGSCSKAAQAKLNKQWLDEPTKAKKYRDRTYYVESKRNKEGKYSVDVAHYCPRGKKWMAGVYVEAAKASNKAAMHKTMNDVVTQCG